MNFKKKIALVTGASRGIGRAISEKFAQQNIIVIGTSTNKKGAQIISSYLGNNGKGVELDFTNTNSVNFFLKKIRLEFGNIDILVNNAGITNDSLLVYMQEKKWQSIIDINLTSVFKMSKAVISNMLKKRYGRIIIISSVVSVMGNAGQTNYAAAKAGLIGFSKSLAKEVASRGITVNVVSPGFINTSMTKILTEKHRSNILSCIPMNRFGKPEEIANVVSFLASEEASYITGATIHVNGGMYMS